MKKGSKNKTREMLKRVKGFWLATEWVVPLNPFLEDTLFWHKIEGRLLTSDEARKKHSVRFVEFEYLEKHYGKIEAIDFDSVYSHNGVVIWTERKVISVDLTDETSEEYLIMLPRHPTTEL